MVAGHSTESGAGSRHHVAQRKILQRFYPYCDQRTHEMLENDATCTDTVRIVAYLMLVSQRRPLYTPRCPDRPTHTHSRRAEAPEGSVCNITHHRRSLSMSTMRKHTFTSGTSAQASPSRFLKHVQIIRQHLSGEVERKQRQCHGYARPDITGKQPLPTICIVHE